MQNFVTENVNSYYLSAPYVGFNEKDQSRGTKKMVSHGNIVKYSSAKLSNKKQLMYLLLPSLQP